MFRFEQKQYDDIPDTISPVLNNAVVRFNAIGLKHLLRKPRKRSHAEQAKRFALLQYAPRIIADSNASILYRKVIRYDLKITQYWALDKIIDGKRLRVVVRQVGDGNKHFFSIMERQTKNPA
ncbi:MAG: hypothetical protein NT077_02430 [Candidatus Taylorbacteria bacterium]|nr:hypothetical protein [Candidatus Taylorbacteria bacterium]